MKKVIIIPACTDLNRGDQALVWEAAYLIKDALYSDPVNIKIVDYGMNVEDRKRQSQQTQEEGFSVIRNIVENPKRILSSSSNRIHTKKTDIIQVGFLALIDFIRHLIVLLMPNKKLFSFLFKDKGLVNGFNELYSADVFVIKGGGFLHTYGKLGDLYYLWFGLYYVLFAKRLGKKVIMLPNSIGPITGKLNKLFIKYVFKKIDLIYVREKVSLKCLNDLDIFNVRFAFDLGYYARPYENRISSSVISDSSLMKRKVGITVRPYRFPKSTDPKEQYKKYIEAFVSFCNKNKENNIFYFIVQVKGPSAHETDRIAIDDIVCGLIDVDYIIIDNDMNYKELLEVYAEMDFLIGTRFHSVIFSQLMNTPAIAIAYGGNKTRGIMQEIGLEEFVEDIENLSCEKIEGCFKSLLEQQDMYKEKLINMIDTVKFERQHMMDEINMVFHK